MKGLWVILSMILFHFYAHAQEMSYTVLFEYDKFDIPDSSLIRIIKIINNHKIDRVLLAGHCDNIGSKEYNYTLSDNRANEVKKLLIQNGISPKSVKKCIGFGKDKPLTLNETEMERQINRRVEMTFYLYEEPKPIIKDTIPAIKVTKKIVEKAPKPRLKGELSKLATAEIGENIVLENILFQPGRHILKEESYEDLDNLITAMQHYPTLEIEIQGHVCCATTEPDGYDWDTETNNLSEMRAREIYFFLIKNNIDKKRLKYRGFGGRYKINLDESTEELRKVNRRVEIKILKK
ncbi:MAG: OmpA family protein [Bacteroidetes bacterium]|nr:OmpA family protein [Bacteroidota bacterium]